MKQLTSLFWKEWHETRIFLLIGLGIFLGLPCIGGVEAMFQTAHRFEILATYWVLIFGGVFAILVAVGATSRDLSGHLEDFWRSRPVGDVRWFLTKYLVGLAITLVVCALPIFVQQVVNANENVNVSMIILTSFMWTTFYTMAFAAGCLIRRPAHAAMIALAGLLLIYCLPLVVPSLSDLNAIGVIDDGASQEKVMISSYAMTFATGMSAITIVMLTLAIVAVRYHWHIVAGRRLIYGAASAAVLIIIATAGYRLGTNLPVLQQIALDDNELVQRIAFDGQHGEVITGRDRGPKPEMGFDLCRRSLALTTSGFAMGAPSIAPGGQYFIQQSFRTDIALVSGHPELLYCVDDDGIEPNHDYRLVIRQLQSTALRGQDGGLKLWTVDFDPRSRKPSLYLWKNHLFVLGDRLVTLDITDPFAPQVVSNVPFSFHPITPQEPAAFSLILPRVPELPKEQRLEAVMRGSWDSWYFPEERILCQSGYGGSDGMLKIIAWRLNKLTDEIATFESIGQYDQNLFEAATGTLRSAHQAAMKDGLLYLTTYGRGYTNDRVLVFDLRREHSFRPVAHFSAPFVWIVCPLPDGRALIGGSKLWLVGPPPSHTQRD